MEINKHMKPIHLFPIFPIIFVTASGCVSENGQSGTYDNETEALSYQGRVESCGPELRGMLEFYCEVDRSENR